MSSGGPRVLFVAPPGAYLRRPLVEDLRASGPDVEAADRGRDALAAARARPPAAIVTLDGLPTGWVRAVARHPALAAVPLVGVVRGRGTTPRLLPFPAPVRWDCVVRPRDLDGRGAASAAVRELGVARLEGASP